MIRHIRRTAAFLLILLAMTATLAACNSTTSAPAQGGGPGQGQGHGQGQRGQGQIGGTNAMPAGQGGQGPMGAAGSNIPDIDLLPREDLSDAERAGLYYMREEEKLAHDVYIALYDKWGSTIFDRISLSETRHTNMVLALIQKYNLDDPAAGKAPGEFSNPDLQALYDQLIAQGSQSLAEALKVGGAIEEIDILDLEERLAQADNEDIRAVYENLMMGSENHLRAFTRMFAQETGETYQPQFMDKDAYDAIISAPMGPGSHDKGNHDNHSQGNCGGHGEGNHDNHGQDNCDGHGEGNCDNH